MKTERQKLIKSLDDLFRSIIRKRDKVCQRSGKRDNLQVAHFFTRSNLTTRWDEMNAVLLNAGIHNWWAHSKYEEYRDWFILHIGQQEFERLKLKNRCRGTIHTSELRLLKIALKKRLSELRGVTR